MFTYSTTVAGIVYVQKWKEELPTKEELLVKILEYAEMAILTVRIKEQNEGESLEEWKYLGEYLGGNTMV